MNHDMITCTHTHTLLPYLLLRLDLCTGSLLTTKVKVSNNQILLLRGTNSMTPRLRPQHRPACRRGPALLLLFSLASLSDSTEVLLEWTPSSAISSTISPTDSGGGWPSTLSGGLAGDADSALGSAALFSASSVNKNNQHVNLTTCHLKTLRLIS